MVSHVRGHLGPVSGTIFIDEQDLSRSRIEVSVDARGIDSREPKRDEHLRSADFLDVANHPTVTFRSTRVEAPARAGGDLRVTGDLTIRGVTRPVTLEVEALPPAIQDPWGNRRRGVSARARINRKDWGLKWNIAIEAGGVAVADEVAIEIDAEIVARKA
jgi:polyisoprenoid-binding protein YceI